MFASIFCSRLTIHIWIDRCRMCLFGASWLCSQCGKDFCLQCHTELAQLKVPPTRSCSVCNLLIYIQNGAVCLSLTSCVSSTAHESASFIPCSRYTEQDILHIMNTMEERSKLAVPPVLHTRSIFYKHARIDEAELKSFVLRIPAGQLKTTEFRHFLAKRIPLVITDLNHKLQLSWSPSHLIDNYGSDICSLEDCEEKEPSVKMRLGTFLSRFMHPACSTSTDSSEDVLPCAIWRIKVWIDLLI